VRDSAFTRGTSSSRSEPRSGRNLPTADSYQGFAPNELITVDGRVRNSIAPSANNEPWDSDVWFHLANDAGWVTFAGVRADPTDPSTAGNFGEGSSGTDRSRLRRPYRR
jgi:hypothetical protein